MTRFVVLAALPLLFSADPGHAQDARAAIEEGAIAWETAFNAGDGKAVAELYTEDAALLPPDAERVDGKAAIAEFWQGAIPGCRMRILSRSRWSRSAISLMRLAL